MKDKACCYDCLNCITQRGISSCKITGKELVNRFESSVCGKFECFQCSKKNRECNCYEEMK